MGRTCVAESGFHRIKAARSRAPHPAREEGEEGTQPAPMWSLAGSSAGRRQQPIRRRLLRRSFLSAPGAHSSTATMQGLRVPSFRLSSPVARLDLSGPPMQPGAARPTAKASAGCARHFGPVRPAPNGEGSDTRPAAGDDKPLALRRRQPRVDRPAACPSTRTRTTTRSGWCGRRGSAVPVPAAPPTPRPVPVRQARPGTGRTTPGPSARHPRRPSPGARVSSRRPTASRAP